jgi:hypothetical protein
VITFLFPGARWLVRFFDPPGLFIAGGRSVRRIVVSSLLSFLVITAILSPLPARAQWQLDGIPLSAAATTSSGVTPVPVNFLTDATDTVLVDAITPASALYYIVTANDVHANQGPSSNVASVQATTGVGNLPPITRLDVLPNHPNPFTNATELQIGLPASSPITLEVFDVAGRRVRQHTFAGVKGWQSVHFGSVDEGGQMLASGVYFCRVTAAGETFTRKMVIAR